jgi:hypothetical protein
MEIIYILQPSQPGTFSVPSLMSISVQSIRGSLYGFWTI